MRGRGKCRLLREFLPAQRPEGPQEYHELPTVGRRFLMRIAPGRHAGELNSVFDDVVQLAIGQSLRGRGAQIRNSRIKMTAYRRGAAAVDSVTARALSQEEFTALVDGIWIGLERILLVPIRFGNG